MHRMQDIKELREIHTSHMKAVRLMRAKVGLLWVAACWLSQVFRDLRLVQRRPTLDAFTAVVQHALHAQQPVRHKVRTVIESDTALSRKAMCRWPLPCTACIQSAGKSSAVVLLIPGRTIFF